jgi:rhodanese-related sulfurtransferase
VTIPGPVPSVDVAEAARQLGGADDATRPLLIDVREDYEFRALRVPGAVLLPMSTMTERYGSLPRDRPLLVMCAAGRRSLVVAEFLGRNGFSAVTNVDGGIDAWQRAGLPVSDASPSPDEGRLPAG